MQYSFSPLLLFSLSCFKMIVHFPLECLRVEKPRQCFRLSHFWFGFCSVLVASFFANTCSSRSHRYTASFVLVFCFVSFRFVQYFIHKYFDKASRPCNTKHNLFANNIIGARLRILMMWLHLYCLFR